MELLRVAVFKCRFGVVKCQLCDTLTNGLEKLTPTEATPVRRDSLINTKQYRAWQALVLVGGAVCRVIIISGEGGTQ